MDLLKKILDQMSSLLEAETGLSVLFDPQPVKVAAPSLRLVFLGSEGFGVKATMLKWQIALIGAGDGPDVYLPAVMAASLRLERLYDKCKGPQFIDFNVDGVSLRMCFVAALEATGSFSVNENKIVETGQWSYLWTEPKYLSVTVPDELLFKE